MKNFRASAVLRSRYTLAIFAGLLLAASFPNFRIAGLAWIAPGLILAAALGRTGGESFRIGYVAGLTHYLVALYWLLLIPYRWHGLPLGPALGWVALSAFMALYPATWVWLMSPGGRRGPGAASQEYELQAPPQQRLPLFENGHGPLAASWLERTLWNISGAATWVALEMTIARLFTGFPWDLLGDSQYQMVPLIQIASITGIYGLSFLVTWTSLSLLSAGLMALRRPTLRSGWIGEIILPVAAMGALFVFGFHELRQASPSTRTLNVTFVQPSIPQTLIWDANGSDERFRELIRLSELALTNRTDLLLWPEASVPKLPRWDQPTFDALANLARSHHVWLIVGADDAEPRRNPAKPGEADYFNSSFLFSPEGKLIERYRKRGLVIFGEYIPLVRWLPFIRFFTPIDSGYTRGEGAVPFRLNSPDVKTSVLICFEDIFPHLAREYADDDTDFLVNITNNGWFGEGAAQWQHGISGLFRAVENRLPLLRCSNNGLTCWIDAQGRLRQIFLDQKGTIYGPGFMTAEIPLLAPGEKRLPTFYHEHGDWFGWGCVAWSSLWLVRRLAGSKQRV